MPLNLVFVLAALANLATAIPLNETSLIPNTTNLNVSALNSTAPHTTVPNATMIRLRIPRPEADSDLSGHKQLKVGCFFNKGTRRCLDVEQSRSNGWVADAQMWRCNYHEVAQRLMIYGPEDWSRFFIHAQFIEQLYEPYYSYCLDVAEAKFFNGAAVRWWSCNYSKAQQWGYNPQFGHIYPIARPDLCLDPVGGIRGSFDGQGMQLWKCVKGEQGHNWDLADWISPVCRP